MATEPERFLNPNELAMVRRLAALLGERQAARALHVSRGTLQRILLQLPSQPGTVALVRQQLAERRETDDGDRTTPIM